MNVIEDFHTKKNIKNEKNKFIIEEFINYYKYIYLHQDLLDKAPKEIYYKLANIKRVIEILSEYKNMITLEELPKIKNIKFIGEKTIDRLKEILTIGYISEIKNLKEREKVITELTNIYSIGSKKAIKLFNIGVRSIADLEKMENKGEIVLSHQEKLGIKYYKVLITKIPRISIVSFDIYVQNILDKIDNNYISVLCGSYRREKDFSGDIDILITNKNLKNKNDCKKYLDQVIEGLGNFIVDSLTIKNYNNHYQGFGCFKNVLNKDMNKYFDLNSIIRFDIIVVPIESLFTAIMHFTGSGDFNQKMRNIAKQKNMKLNEYELLDSNNKKIKINSENDIFKNLNMEYIKPENR
jgi:DNA polymerase/3'-5' exonuclease PolX